MKRLFLAVALTAVSLFAEVDWALDYGDALEQSREEGKPVLVMLSMEDCNYCFFMKDIVFKKESVSEFLNNRVVSVVLDINEDPVPAALKPYGTPTFYLVDGQGSVLSKPIVGAAQAKVFMARITEELEKIKN